MYMGHSEGSADLLFDGALILFSSLIPLPSVDSCVMGAINRNAIVRTATWNEKLDRIFPTPMGI
jgi:hypothetical protein